MGSHSAEMKTIEKNTYHCTDSTRNRAIRRGVRRDIGEVGLSSVRLGQAEGPPARLSLTASVTSSRVAATRMATTGMRRDLR